MNKFTKLKSRGFTLIEMTMVMMIVGLLLAGLLPNLYAQMESRRINETRKQLEEIKEALVGFVIINGRLPCPADSLIPTGQLNAGKEAKTGPACTNITNNRASGVIPWAALGINETDAWGRRFTYSIASYFADDFGNNTYTYNTSSNPCVPNPAPTQSSFALCSPGNLVVAASATYTANITDNAPAVIVSHGANGLGAYMPNGGNIPITGASSDEASNADNNNDFVYHEATSNFDDQVIWLSTNILFNRMVAAGKLP